jgi:hypothetical protein
MTSPKAASAPPWYKFAQSLQRMDRDSLKKVLQGKHHRAHLARIAHLYRGIGEELDTLHAPLRIYAFVAYAPSRPGVPRELAQQTRFRAALDAFQLRGRWPLPAALTTMGLDVDERLGVVRPRKTPAGMCPGDAELNAQGASASAQTAALLTQHPEIAGMLAEFAARRRQET